MGAHASESNRAFQIPPADNHDVLFYHIDMHTCMHEISQPESQYVSFCKFGSRFGALTCGLKLSWVQMR